MSIGWTRELDEAGVVRLAEVLALKLRQGDAVALQGDLGAGKTTLARALIRALLGDDNAEVPSPTFSLRQTYETSRLGVSHFDFYRLGDADEVFEIGIDDALAFGAVIVEWPERADGVLSENRFDIALEETDQPDRRRVSVRGHGTAAARVARIGETLDFLDRNVMWGDARIGYLQGDASARSYARLSKVERTALLMDAPRQPDGPPIRNGKSYSRLAHLAEDTVRPFSAIAQALKEGGLSAPAILDQDAGRGFMLIEDLGDRVFAAEVARSAQRMDELWQAAVDALIAVRDVRVPDSVPAYDGEALGIEVELLLDWYWPALKGEPAPTSVRAEFLELWRPLFERLARQPQALVLRDYHSPNLIWLPERSGVQRVGIIDFQDAQRGSAAYDLASLLQDARVDVPASLEQDLLGAYCNRLAGAAQGFDRGEFRFAYNALGAQRSTKILGIFVRLAHRDGKRQYLAHLPRIWGYLARNLTHVSLAPLGTWYEKHFPVTVRDGALPG
jgi:tRNA threonylcarbamoyl adenosine modification protein YjeE